LIQLEKDVFSNCIYDCISGHQGYGLIANVVECSFSCLCNFNVCYNGLHLEIYNWLYLFLILAIGISWIKYNYTPIHALNCTFLIQYNQNKN